MDELRGEKLNRVKLVEKEKDELEKPKNEAMEYLRSENDISHKKNFIYQHYIKTFDEKIEETKQKQAEFQEKCKETLEKLTKITEKKEKRENAMKELSQKFDGTSKELEKARESFKKHEMTDEKLREDMKSLNTKRKKTMKLSQIEKENYEKISKVPEVNKGKIEECQGLLEKHTEKETEEQKRYVENQYSFLKFLFMAVHTIRPNYEHPMGLIIYEVKWQVPRGQENLYCFQPTIFNLQSYE